MESAKNKKLSKSVMAFNCNRKKLLKSDTLSNKFGELFRHFKKGIFSNNFDPSFL